MELTPGLIHYSSCQRMLYPCNNERELDKRQLKTTSAQLNLKRPILAAYKGFLQMLNAMTLFLLNVSKAMDRG